MDADIPTVPVVCRLCTDPAPQVDWRIVCICGRLHAPWWMRYVKAPSCTASPSELSLDTFLSYGRAVARAH